MNHVRLAALGACILTFAIGCATTGGDRAQYQKDGVQYGVTKGAFRGRWWNYYERGRSFQDGGFFREAEQDLQTAVRQRGRDQLWARTYGLHFVPEYFPHRELGVTYYYQKRFEEAASELEVSLGYRYSARAAYFLNLSRRELVQARSGPHAPPTITFTKSPQGDALGVSETEISGVAASENYIARLWVGDHEVEVPVTSREFLFSQRVTLTPGINDLTVIAEDLAGMRATQSLKLQVDLDGPAVSFDTPIVVPGTVHGVVFDPDGVASLKVAGNDATLTLGGNGSVAFVIDVTGPDSAGQALTYEAKDNLGNTTKGVVPGDALRLTFNLMGSVQPHWRPEDSRNTAPPILLRLASGDPSAESPPPLRIDFQNLRNGQQYQRDEIVASVRIEGTGPVADGSINSYSLTLIPDRAIQYVSRRVSLSEGTNTFTASARDSHGNSGSATVTVERKPTILEAPENRLTVTSLGLVWAGNAPKLEGEREFLYDRLNQSMAEQNRFNFADRSLMPQILDEQQLSAVLGSREGRLTLTQVTPAEAVVIGRARRDPTSLEVVMEAFSTETGLSIARADVAGRADTVEELQQLIDDLALRVVQEFPRAQGEVEDIRGRLSDASYSSVSPVIAIVGFSAANSELTEAQAEVIQDEFERSLRNSNTLKFVNREVMANLLTEQQLSEALGSRDALLATGKTLAADVLIRGQLFLRAKELLVSAELIDTATSETIKRSEANAPFASEDDLRRVGARLAVEVQSALAGFEPKRQVSAIPESFVSTLGRLSLVRESTKCLVYRYGPDILDPATKEVLGREITLLGEGLVRSLNDTSSIADVVISKPSAAPQPITPGDYVITK
ncbi:MAG: hypothetical protein K1Y02_14985 [Candidatus Hydrogenedentes bacterium]|nr:hypothetical protein [Candidatus Hydrogenedentota bacterium]